MRKGELTTLTIPFDKWYPEGHKQRELEYELAKRFGSAIEIIRFTFHTNKASVVYRRLFKEEAI